MTNREQYKRTFRALHPSQSFSVEVSTMNSSKKLTFPRPVAVTLAVCILVIGTLTVAYAADIGGFRETVRVWFNGEQYDVHVEQTEDGYHAVFETEDGVDGVLITGTVIEDGVERDLTEAEAHELMNGGLDVAEDENGRVWLYYYDEKADITDQFDENGLCAIDIAYEGETVHVEVTREGDGQYAFSTAS